MAGDLRFRTPADRSLARLLHNNSYRQTRNHRRSCSSVDIAAPELCFAERCIGSYFLNTVNGVAPSPAVPDTVAVLSPGTNTIPVGLPAGSDAITVSIYASSNASGTALATNTVTQTVGAGIVNTIRLTLGGVAQTIALNGPFVAPADGATHTFNLSVTAKDASGATIIAPGNYASPINLTVTGDANHALSLAVSQLTVPSATGPATVTVTYDATKALTSGTITASASGATSATTTVNPLVYSPANLNALAVSGANGFVSVSEAGYGGAFALGGLGTTATTLCAPVTCAPTASGGTVVIAVTGATAGSATLNISDTNGASAHIPVKVASSGGSVTVPGAPVSTTFGVGFAAAGVSAGPDGNVWYGSDVNQIAASATNGSPVHSYTLAGVATLFYVTSGPDGRLWFTSPGDNLVGAVTTAGVATLYTVGIGAASQPIVITSGPDGNLWFTEIASGKVASITPSGTVTEYATGGNPLGIVTGSDGKLWFADIGGSIGSITTAGTIVHYSAGLLPSASPHYITAGPDGNLWFTDSQNNAIGRITTAGVITEFTAGVSPSALLFQIVAGGDGNLWFTDLSGSGLVGRVTTSGVITELPSIAVGLSAAGIALGPDGNLWYVASGSSNVLVKVVP